MALDAETQARCEEFRQWFRRRLANDPRFGKPTEHDAADGSTLVDRYPIGRHLWMELAIRLQLPQVRVGVVTDDRWQSEQMEQHIEDSGDTMPEFIEMAMGEAGLSWPEPPVEHYRDQGRLFYFATPIEADPPAVLADEAFRRQTHQAFEGYYNAFKKFAGPPD